MAFLQNPVQAVPELHHTDQTMNGGTQEMTRTDHRLGGNLNHCLDKGRAECRRLASVDFLAPDALAECQCGRPEPVNECVGLMSTVKGRYRFARQSGVIKTLARSGSLRLRIELTKTGPPLVEVTTVNGSPHGGGGRRLSSEARSGSV